MQVKTEYSTPASVVAGRLKHIVACIQRAEHKAGQGGIQLTDFERELGEARVALQRMQSCAEWAHVDAVAAAQMQVPAYEAF